MNKEVDTYKIFRQLEERRKRRNPYTFYDKDELVDEILKLEDNLDHLTNNWNELEKRVKEYINKNDNWYNNELSTHDKRYYEDSYYTKNAVLMTILDKMKEIKEGKDND